MPPILSQCRIYIDYVLGNYQLKRIKSYNINDGEDNVTVNAVGVDGGAGTQFKTGGGDISLEVYRESGTPEVEWWKLKRQHTNFSLTFQDDGGPRVQFQGCTVAQAPFQGDAEGSHMMTVKVNYLNVKFLPPQ